MRTGQADDHDHCQLKSHQPQVSYRTMLEREFPPLESFYFDTACTTQTKLNQSTASKHISDTDHYLVCCELSKKVTKVVYYAMHIPFSVWGAVPSDPLLCVSPPNRILYDRDPAQAEPAPGNSLLSKVARL